MENSFLSITEKLSTVNPKSKEWFEENPKNKNFEEFEKSQV